MWYSALEIARYVISRCSEVNKPISNLKLQKMLYFIWVDFYKQTGRKLFLDDICAWQLGPVVPNVYYEYCSYAGKPIHSIYSPGIEPEDQDVIDGIIAKYIDIAPNRLVAKTHTPGSAWDETYKNGLGERSVIPHSLIIAKETGQYYAC